MKQLVLGIDTGGTYTDGVLMDYDSRQVLASSKSLTTKRNLSIGIERVIENIRIKEPSEVKMVSISTTLATNAIAEGRRKQVALFLIGYDPDLIDSFNMASRFATPHYYYIAGGHDLFGKQKEALDVTSLIAKVLDIKDQIDAIAISSYFSPLNPEHETQAYQVISQKTDLPIILGHQLSKKLGSIERATTAALNASLIAVLQEFMEAVQKGLKNRRIQAPLMVVRGDGTLMSAEFAARTPVETIHSGPAASAIGGHFLARLDNALVVDVGGTTTDLALIEKGEVAVQEEGARVGDYKTSVKAANLLSIGMGGDSHIHLKKDSLLAIGPERVTPIAYLAYQHPRIQERLSQLSNRSSEKFPPEWLEYWFLLRKPKVENRLTPKEKNLIEILKEGPLPLPEILERLDLLHVSQIGLEDLLRREIIGKGGLTPTDLLHIGGGYDIWDHEAAHHAWEIFCRYQFADKDELRRSVWEQITEAITGVILTFLTGQPIATNPTSLDLGTWFFQNSLYDTHPHIETRIRLRQPIIGLGAPARFFLEDVAKKLQTELILPKHHEVANAIGAVAGTVMVEEEILIYPQLTEEGLEVIGYYVQAHDERHHFKGVSEALTFARNLGKEITLRKALRSGAEEPQTIVDEIIEGMDTFRVQVRAVGNPRLSKNHNPNHLQ